MKYTVTKKFWVDAYGKVYDEDNIFYCNWMALTKEEKEIVKQNEFSEF